MPTMNEMFFYPPGTLWMTSGDMNKCSSTECAPIGDGTRPIYGARRVRKVASFSIFWNLEILFCEISDCKEWEFLVWESIYDAH